MKATAGLCYLIAFYFARKNDLLKIENQTDEKEIDKRKESSEKIETNKETSC